MSREYETFIVCPYCGYQHQDMYDYPFVKWNDGEEKGIDCAECGKDFDVTINVSYSFCTYEKEPKSAGS